LARRATLIKQLRDTYADLLVLDSGNALVGEAATLGNRTQGKIVIEAMNMIGYDAMVLGERELSLGPTILRQRMQEAAFPLLSANVVISATGELFAQPYVIREMGGHTVAIVGLTEPLSPIRVAGESEALLARDPIQFGVPYVQEAAQKADIVIVLSHMGTALDEQRAAAVPAIDLIVGGRDRVLRHPTRYNDSGPLITQVSIEGQVIGVVDLKIDPVGKVVRFSGRLEALGEEVPDDPEMRALLNKYANQ